MQYKRLAVVSMGILAAALTLSGCARNSSIATVNGDRISKDEFYSRLERLNLPNGNGQSVQAGPLILNQMVEDKLWEQLAKEQKVTPTEAQVNKKLEWQKKAEDLSNQLRQQGLSADDYKKMLWPKLAQFNVLTKGISVSDKDVTTAYEQNKNKQPFSRPVRTRIAIIMASSQQKIEEAYNKVTSGADFAKVATEMSEDPVSKPRGGELGWVFTGMPGVPLQLIATANAASVSSVSKPVNLPVGSGKNAWVIIKAVDRKPAIHMTFAESKDFIRDKIAEQKAMQNQSLINVYRDKFISSKIVLNSDKYKGLQQNLEKAQKEYQKINKKAGSTKP